MATASKINTFLYASDLGIGHTATMELIDLLCDMDVFTIDEAGRIGLSSELRELEGSEEEDDEDVMEAAFEGSCCLQPNDPWGGLRWRLCGRSALAGVFLPIILPLHLISLSSLLISQRLRLILRVRARGPYTLPVHYDFAESVADDMGIGIFYYVIELALSHTAMYVQLCMALTQGLALTLPMNVIEGVPIPSELEHLFKRAQIYFA